MADSKRESRVVKPIVHTADGKFVGCGNEACYCAGYCRESGRAKPSGEDAGVRITNKSEDNSEIYISVKADVGDAITGFKSLSRELREATKVARELEQAYSDGKKVSEAVYARDFGLSTHRDLSEVPTEVLHEELSRRKRDE